MIFQRLGPLQKVDVASGFKIKVLWCSTLHNSGLKAGVVDNQYVTELSPKGNTF